MDDFFSRLLKKPGGTDYYSSDSIYQVLTGRRTESGVSIDPLCGAIAAFRRGFPVSDDLTVVIGGI